MPIYVFKCTECGKVDEHYYPSPNVALNPVCPHCASRKMKRQPVAANFSLVGAGFHKNDYPK